MSVQATVQRNTQIGGKTFRENQVLTGETMIVKEVELAAAKTGTLTTRTDANTGTLTMAGGHGITTGARLDLYWSGGSRRGITVGTVATNSVPIDLGAGDDLPAATTVITAMVPDSEAIVFSGDDVVAIAACSEALQPSQVTFTLSDNTEEWHRTLAVGQIMSWDDESGITNPLAGEAIAKVFLSHSDATGTRKMRVAVLLDT